MFTRALAGVVLQCHCRCLHLCLSDFDEGNGAVDVDRLLCFSLDGLIHVHAGTGRASKRLDDSYIVLGYGEPGVILFEVVHRLCDRLTKRPQ